MLFNEPKLLKSVAVAFSVDPIAVSVLFNEPKLLKSIWAVGACWLRRSFSALQRAEIAEIRSGTRRLSLRVGVSVLFNEPKLLKSCVCGSLRCSTNVSVLFNEPKLLKS